MTTRGRCRPAAGSASKRPPRGAWTAPSDGMTDVVRRALTRRVRPSHLAIYGVVFAAGACCAMRSCICRVRCGTRPIMR